VYEGYDKFLKTILRNLIKNKKVINCYIDDVEYERRIPYSIFVCIEKSQTSIDAVEALSSTKHQAYIDHYEYDDIIMLVLAVPDKYKKSYNNFFLSRYSRMYTIGDLNKFFKLSDGSYIKAYYVLSKNSELEEEIKEKYGLDEDIELDELDELLNMKKECFNYLKIFNKKELEEGI